MEPVLLDKILKKCHKEENIQEDDQPLYIDDESKSIKCHWCRLFKGSIEVRVLNQHAKTSKTHLKHQQSLCSESSEETTGVMDIRNYFQSLSHQTCITAHLYIKTHMT